MIRFFIMTPLGLLLLWAGLNTIRQITGGKRLFDTQSLAVAMKHGTAMSWFALFVTVVGALIVGISIFIFIGTLVILIFDPV